MRVLLVSNKTKNIMLQPGLSSNHEVQLLKNVFDNKISVTELRNFIEKIAYDIKKICIEKLLPLLHNFQKVFVFCVGSLGRAVARLVSEGCSKDVIFVDAMFDKFPSNKVDGLLLVSPEELYSSSEEKCVIVCNPQPAIEKKIAEAIKKNEQPINSKKFQFDFW
jgi:hypothetical protein